MTTQRTTPIQIQKDEFKKMGHQLVEAIAEFIDTIEQRPVTTGESPKQLQTLLGSQSIPEEGTSAQEILTKAVDLLFNHSLLNGHPKFFGYITASPAPMGALADLLAATVNPNVGANILSPIATQIEKQTVRWLADLIGVAPTYGGLLVSGGNMANFTAFLAARTAKAPNSIKEKGLASAGHPLVIYCSKTTHTWVEKAAILFGLGSNAIRWIPTDSHHRMDNAVLEQTIKTDLSKGCQPMLVIGTAGDVSTGAVDQLGAIASLCKTYDVWFHIDGAYGMPAAAIPALKDVFEGFQEADSIALDPHKWLYSPLEAGCTLVKNPHHLLETFSVHPVYYNFSASDEAEVVPHNYYEYGLQNSRGFRALKVWLLLQQVGRQGYIRLISEDISLAKLLFDLANRHPELEAITHSLSITTLRYIPLANADEKESETYLNRLNESLLNALQQGGQVFLSNAVIHGKYCLRACIVNFRTSKSDIAEVIAILVGEGRKMHHQLQAFLD